MTNTPDGQHHRRHFSVIAGALVRAASRGGRELAAAMLDMASADHALYRAKQAGHNRVAQG